MNDYSMFVPNVHFEKIPIKNLVSNQDYQRSLSQAHIERAAANFDLCQINPVKVSRRNGINYVFNGQHTIEIVALVSGSRETPVWCMIYDDLCYEHEADIFANQMKFVKPLQPYEVFAANVEAGNNAQLIIRDLIQSYGLQIGTKRGPNCVCAISTVESIYEKFGYQVLNRVIRLIVGTWEGDPSSFSANILNAVAKLVVVYKDALDEDQFIEKLGCISIRQLVRMASERRRGSMGVAEVMVLEYNGKKKNALHRLFINKLYSKESSIVLSLGYGDTEHPQELTSMPDYELPEDSEDENPEEEEDEEAFPEDETDDFEEPSVDEDEEETIPSDADLFIDSILGE